MSSPEENAGPRDPEVVREIFNRIAARYDFANHFLSAGCDFLWRKHAAKVVAKWAPPCVLDAATGSGDFAVELQRKMPSAKVSGLDFSPEMLALARRKGVRETIVGDVLALPFAEQSFDAVTVAFGLRNMRDWAAALREMRRILTSSGHLLVLEFSLPHNPMLRAAYRFYLHQIVPRLAAVITGEESAYEYLGASIETFPSGHAMCEFIESNGFQNATADPMTAGIVTIYTAKCAALP